MTPCRMPIWLAGVVAGSLGVHSCSVWVPPLIHRDRVGTVPALTAICSTGKGTPSSWTKTTPQTSGSSISTSRPRLEATIRPTSASEVPAVVIQPMTVATSPITTATSSAVTKSSTLTPGSSRAAMPTTSA